MKFPSACDFLELPARKERKINRILSKIANLQDKAERITSAYGSVPVTQSPTDSRWDAAAALADARQELKRAEADFIRTRAEVETLIESLSDDRYITVLTLRWLEGLTWEKVAEGAGYEPRHVQRIHNKALEEVERRLAIEKTPEAG